MSNQKASHTNTKLAFVLGTRPEIIKMAPLVRECQQQNQPFILIHTGQHYSDSLDSVFFEQLELPTPDYHLGVGSAPHGEQTGKMLIEIERVLHQEEPHVLFVQGDTNSVLAGALAASKRDCELAHVEAGLRSFDRNMPEETNRVVADHVSDYLFVPTSQSKEYLLEEGIPRERIVVTGNTVVDALYRNKEIARKKSSILSEYDVQPEEYFLMTAHRAENVDNKQRFENLLSGVAKTAKAYALPVIYPAHPRASKKIKEFGLDIPDQIQIVDPVDYLDFIQLQSQAKLILTDSGGVQEEACVLGTPCVTLRNNTERPETVDVGANRLSGIEPNAIFKEARMMMTATTKWQNPFGDGTAAQKMLDVVTTKRMETVIQ